MDTYQPIYDAVRSKISNGDIGAAVESALRDAQISWYLDRITETFHEAASEMQRASILLKPKVYIDGDQWCALYGDNLQDGIAGFGKSPSLAFQDFDSNFRARLPSEGQ